MADMTVSDTDQSNQTNASKSKQSMVTLIRSPNASSSSQTSTPVIQATVTQPNSPPTVARSEVPSTPIPSLPASTRNSRNPEHSQFGPSRLMMPHKKSRRFAKIFLFLLFITTIVFFFLSFDCWPALSSLFEMRRFSPNESACGRSCVYRNKGAKLHPVSSHSHHSNSLLARPLKHLSNSFSIARLSKERVEALLKKETSSERTTTFAECENRTFWRTHQRETAENRVSRLRSLCNLYDFDGKIFTYRTKSSNRAKNSNSSKPILSACSTHTCPLLINTRERVLACFVQKAASTSLKTLFLKLDGNNDTSLQSTDNLTVFHNRANDALHRISPVSLMGKVDTNGYTKVLFARHPFVRLVSGFKDKAEVGPETEPFFWSQYWRPLLDKLHGRNRDPELKLTFKEFVDQYLLVTDPYIWDEHWAPIWTRCEPCFVKYTLIGKLETSERDFGLLTNIASQHQSPSGESAVSERELWKNRNDKFGISGSVSPCNRLASKYAETRHYLAQLSAESIIELYKKFYLDFELFGYTLEELFA